MIEHTFGRVEPLADGIARLTLPLPTRPGHVHAYLLEEPDGWTLVDTGLALPDADEAFASLGVKVVRIAITHFHPDHVGGAEQAVAATGAPVHQGTLDYEQCVHVWGNPGWPATIAGWFLRHGVPSEVANELLEQGSRYAPFIRFARDPRPLGEGDRVGGWKVLELPGHADGHICLLRDGVLVAGDHLLPDISPAVGLYPDSRPDPLGDYLTSLERTAGLDVRLVLPGHGEPFVDASSRCKALVSHHEDRLARTRAALGDDPRTGYELSIALFGAELEPAARRFAVAETLSHAERLVHSGLATRDEDGRVVTYTAS